MFAQSLLALVMSSSPVSGTGSSAPLPTPVNAIAKSKVWKVGDSDPSDAPEVAVPFGCGLTFPVSQAHDTGSHRHNDVWAWDFRMPEGTPINAAKDGVVRMARGDSKEGACHESAAGKANYVVINHGGGMETQYLHLSRVLVRPGTPVKAGELIGYSGKTGWSCGPHLHFKVTQGGRGGWNNPSIPARIQGFGDPQTNVLVRAPSCGGDAPEIFRAERGDPTPAGKTVLATAREELPAPASTLTPATGGNEETPTADPAIEVLKAEEPLPPQGG